MPSRDVRMAGKGTGRRVSEKDGEARLEGKGGSRRGSEHLARLLSEGVMIYLEDSGSH